MAELVDALDLGSSAERRGGSSPFIRTSFSQAKPSRPKTWDRSVPFRHTIPRHGNCKPLEAGGPPVPGGPPEIVRTPGVARRDSSGLLPGELVLFVNLSGAIAPDRYISARPWTILARGYEDSERP